MIRVLIVDDDKLACMGLRATMPWEKYDMRVVGEAANGKQALEFLETEPVELIMVDLTMPVMDGLQLMKLCREKHPNVRFVVMTFHEDFEHVQGALRLGVLDYISKLKLEMEDCDAIFARISQKLQCVENAAHSAEDDERIAALFQSPLWLYDDLCMEELALTLKMQGYHPRDLDLVVTDAIVRIENTIRLSKRAVPHIHTLAMVVEYLLDFRREAAREAAGIDNTEARILVATHYVNEHYREALHADEVANLVNLSRSYMSICFRKSTGITFNQFLRRKRVLEAQKLLRSTRRSIQEIAAEVGYENYKHFKEVFLDVTGQSAYMYRAGNVRP